MRLLTLLLALFLVAYLVHARLGGNGPVAAPAAYDAAEQQAAAVDAQVQDQFVRQDRQLSQMETGAPAETP